MLISERRYAAELIDREGEVYKFDDIACMLRFAHSHGMQPSETKFYVMDYTSGNDWIDATQSYFVRMNSSVSSPMASGIVAYRDSLRAAGKKEVLLTFNELWATDIGETARSAAEKKP
jgi:copper chaperone NosL